MRLIPGRTKVQVEFFKGVRIADVLIGAVAAGLIFLILLSTIPGRLFIAAGLLSLAVILLVRLDKEPNYIFLLHMLRHFGYRHHYERTYDDASLRLQNDKGMKEAAFEELFSDSQNAGESELDRKARLKAEKAERKADDKKLKDKNVSDEEKDAIWLKRANQSAAKKREKAKKKNGPSSNSYEMEEIMAFTDIKDNFICYGGKYYGAAIEVEPVEFRFFSSYRRAASIENGLGRVLRSLPPEYAANIVKIERPVQFESHLDHEYDKLEELKTSYEKGFLSEDEMKARVEVLYDRINDLRNLCYGDKVVVPFYYVVLFDSDRNQLNNAVRSAVDTLRNAELPVHRLDTKELAVFLKYSNTLDFDEHDIDNVKPEDYAKWAMPQYVQMKARTVLVNQIITHNMRVVSYPSVVGDAWLAGVMSMPATKVVVKCTPMDRAKSVRAIDFSLQELRAQYRATGVDSKRIELQEHIETLSDLLSTLQGDNETLLSVNVYVTCYDINQTLVLNDDPKLQHSSLVNISNMKRSVRRLYSESNLRLNNMDFDQVHAFVGSQISAWDPMHKDGRGIPSNSIAASYPWIFAHISDEKGIKLGQSDGVPVFIDFFRRDSERVNSNMVIVGKSGSGKSYATKSLLANLAADDSKIFILDPENEYTELAHNLHGKFINVGNAQYGRLNPFHIITALDDDEEGSETVSGSYATHLQFLEEFFRQILPDCDRDAMEYLNSIIDRMYTNMGITAETDLSRLKPEDYPIFDDLYDAVLSEFQTTDNEYIRTMLRTLMNYIAKFSTGGRNANIWNGPSTVTTEENFTVFNFQSLLANRNGMIANAQMLLVLKYIDNEIIKNRDYNARYNMKRKIVVVIDEAHVFIDTKFPVALDFMFQLAKRIRKYNGMQIVITQNIKDFVGSEEIARKSTAIINACQYSFVFSLAPNDMDDLCTLYEKAGGINESEQEEIISAPRGQAFAIMSPQSRSTFKVAVPEDVVAMFKEREYISRYFRDADGEAAWEEFMGDARTVREQNVRVKKIVEEEEIKKVDRPHVIFEEISEEEELAKEMAAKAAQEAASAGGKSITFTEEIEPEEEFVIPETAAATPAVPVVDPALVPKSAQPLMQPVVVQAPASSGETERLLAELLSKFSHDAMQEEIRRAVDAALAVERAGTNAAGGIATEPTVAQHEVPGMIPGGATTVPVDRDEVNDVPPAATTAEAAVEQPAEQPAVEEKPVEQPAEQPTAEEKPAEQPADKPEEEKKKSEFDIMSLLIMEAKRMGDISPIDRMNDYGETVIAVTLEELAHYNTKHG